MCAETFARVEPKLSVISRRSSAISASDELPPERLLIA
jgi:hypothetical protein